MVLNDDHTVLNMEMTTRNQADFSDTYNTATTPRDNSDTASNRESEATYSFCGCGEWGLCIVCTIFAFSVSVFLPLLIIMLTRGTIRGYDSDGYDSDGYDSDWWD